VRWWLLAGVARVGDTEFSTAQLIERADTDLANGIGNLAHRFAGIAQGFSIPPHAPEHHPLLESARRLPGRVDTALRIGDFRSATAAILALVHDANRLIATEEPWRLRKLARSGDGQAAARADSVLAVLDAACSKLAAELEPFLPVAAHRLRRLLSGERLPQPLFPRAG
jgi:methionyl-tRNA synthetase